jgi:hypothetical protein
MVVKLVQVMDSSFSVPRRQLSGVVQLTVRESPANAQLTLEFVAESHGPVDGALISHLGRVGTAARSPPGSGGLPRAESPQTSKNQNPDIDT